MASGRRLSPRPLVGFGWRRGLRERSWLWRGFFQPRLSWYEVSSFRRVELPQRRAQRIQARGERKSVRLDGAPDCRRYRGELVAGEGKRSNSARRQLPRPRRKLYSCRGHRRRLARRVLLQTEKYESGLVRSSSPDRVNF
jgi:hypothetical protein